MGKRKPFKVRCSNRQKVWSYIGRNRVFRISDISCVLEIKVVSIQSFLWTLQKIGYVKLVSKPTNNFKDWTFKCVKHTGSASPSVSGLSVYDHNTKQRIYIASPEKNNENIFRTLLNMKNEPFSIKHVLEICPNISHAKIGRALSVLRKKEVLIVDSVGKHKLLFYKINKEFKNLIGKDADEKDVAICPVCCSVHTSTKIKEQIQQYNTKECN